MWRKILIGVVVVVVAVPVALYVWIITREPDPFIAVFTENCSVCHGENLEGAAQGTPLVGVDLKHGDTVDEIIKSISEGFPMRGMPGWIGVMNQAQIRSLAIYVVEQRMDMPFPYFRVDKELVIPSETVESELHDFRIEIFTTDLDPWPFSLAAMPDGSFLVTEKMRGMRIISPDGEHSELIQGTPKVYDDGLEIGSLEYGMGWLLDVAPHPDYEENGWIYLHYGDRCEDDCNKRAEESFLPVSMNRLDRGRIKDGKWVDVETIWQADIETYSNIPDIAAGGRLTFDGNGHVFISVGIKGTTNYDGIQDLNHPAGKIHRIRDDGTIPPDNPFVIMRPESDTPATPSDEVTFSRQTVWTYGHRSPQGLEFNFQTNELWGSEMGPRGGDEVNRLLPGKNYGWPLYSLGVNYDGTPVEYWRELDIEFDLEQIEQPVVDFTPAPAISSFVFYEGDAFPEWQHNILIGSLKATELYRLEFENNVLVHKETVIRDLARIRDIEVGYDGLVYLLLEHGKGGQIVRLVPEPTDVKNLQAGTQ